MVVHICNPKQKNCHEFNANLWYIARACLKQTNQPNKTKVEQRICTWERRGWGLRSRICCVMGGQSGSLPGLLACHLHYIICWTAHRAKTTEKVLKLKDLKFKYSPPQASAVLTSHPGTAGRLWGPTWERFKVSMDFYIDEPSQTLLEQTVIGQKDIFFCSN